MGLHKNNHLPTIKTSEASIRKHAPWRLTWNKSLVIILVKTTKKNKL